MKKVIQINVSCNRGSTGRIAEQIGLCAKNHGWEAFIAHGSRYFTPTKLIHYQIPTKIEEYFHYGWNSTILGQSGLGSTKATKRFLSYLNEINPNIVHIHNLHGHYVNYRLLLEYLTCKKIPVVWTMHDCWPVTGHCAYFDSIDCVKWKTGCYDCKLRKDFPKSLIFDTSSAAHRLKAQLIRNLPKLIIVPVSDWLGNIINESLVGHDLNIHVIHNGIDINVFKPVTPVKHGNKKFKILGVADGYGERKGLQDFNMMHEILGDDYEITMVGLQDDEMNHIRPGIRGLKRTENIEELVSLYNEADVYVNPTYSDNFPTTNIEALGCGTPVITYRTGGSPEAINVKTGIVVEQGNVNELVKAIRKLRHNPLKLTDCREHALSLFDKDKCFDQYIDLYNDLL